MEYKILLLLFIIISFVSVMFEFSSLVKIIIYYLVSAMMAINIYNNGSSTVALFFILMTTLIAILSFGIALSVPYEIKFMTNVKKKLYPQVVYFALSVIASFLIWNFIADMSEIKIDKDVIHIIKFLRSNFHIISLLLASLILAQIFYIFHKAGEE